MLKYNMTNMSQGIDFDQTNEPRKCITCNYYYFLKINFRFQPKVCNVLMQKL